MGPLARQRNHGASIFWWFLFEYTLPILCIGLFYFVADLLFELPHAFERTFHGADLLPLSSVLIMSSARELEMRTKAASASVDYEKTRTAAWFIALVLLLIYAVLRFYVLRQEIPATAEEPVKKALTAISTFSLVVMLATGALCFWLKTLAVPRD